MLDLGLSLEGPLPADTAFHMHCKDACLSSRVPHDQGLPVIKFSGFGKAANVTLDCLLEKFS